MIKQPIETWRYMDSAQQNKHYEILEKHLNAMNAGCYELAGHFKRQREELRAQCYKEFRAKIIALETIE